MDTSMQYRRLGRSGLKVSQLSLGSWITFNNQIDVRAAVDCMRVAWESGCNFFDNAEVYARGKSEEVMGLALRELGWSRLQYVVSTKFFWGIEDGVNSKNTLNRKYLMHSIDGSLRRLQLDYVDLVYCHRPDPQTPMDETVWAMHDIIRSGRALYWGTSEWSAAEIALAHLIAARNHLTAPVVEQPEYNLFHRDRVEREYVRLYDDVGLGLTTWSPLASGLLTGKYKEGVPEGSRGALKNMDWLRGSLTDPERNAAVLRLQPIADELGCTLAQLAIAWCSANPRVSSVITGASSVEQVKSNMQAVGVVAQLTPEVKERVVTAIAG
jgi:voltage-dependent potassium channel beta subunit